MTSQLSVDTGERSDAELIAQVRGGDLDAYGVLFERHRMAAVRLARHLTSAGDAEDLVSDAFSSVLRVLMNGGGPDVAFRPYLLTAVRRRHIDSIRAGKRVQATDELDKLDIGQPFADPVVAEFENEAAAQAFKSLPERWQMVLWHMEVEGQKPAEIGVLLGMSANSVSALAYRAREGLKQAYLQNHLADTADAECLWVTERLGAYVRKGLSRRDATKVDQHLDTCGRCSALYLELTDVNSNLRGVIAPVILGGAAVAYLGSIHAGTAGGLGLLAGAARLADLAKAHVAASGGVAAASAVAVTVGVVAVHHSLAPNHQTAANRPPHSASASAGGPSGTSGPSTSPATSSPSKGRPKHHKSKAALIPAVTHPVLPTSTVPGAPVVSLPTPSTLPTSTGITPTGPTTPTTPTTQTTTTTPTNPGPSTIDVSLTESHGVRTTPHGHHHVLLGRLDVTTADPATQLTLGLDTSTGTFLLLRGQGWACTGTGTATASCSTDSATPSPFYFWIIQTPAEFRFQAGVQAADNTDPDPTNNTFSYSGPGHLR